MATVIRTHFFDNEEDERLDARNIHFWRALAGHILADGTAKPGCTILDLGCHRGGLLELLIDRFQPAQVVGLESLTSARQFAARRLARCPIEVHLLADDAWPQVADASVSLVVAHEVLQYIEDLQLVMSQIHRVLAPGGFAYIVLGSHTENPLWPAWKRDVEDLGHQAYDHAPFDLMSAGAAAGLFPSLRPLRDSGWVYYDPSAAGPFRYPTAGALLDHQYRHKLLFRFERRP